MADYQCNYCQDRGSCKNCSWFFEPEEYHNACGFKWKYHKSRNYTSWHDCPKPKHRKED